MVAWLKGTLWDNLLIQQILCLFVLQEQDLGRDGIFQAAFSIMQPFTAFQEMTCALPENRSG